MLRRGVDIIVNNREESCTLTHAHTRGKLYAGTCVLVYLIALCGYGAIAANIFVRPPVGMSQLVRLCSIPAALNKQQQQQQRL